MSARNSMLVLMAVVVLVLFGIVSDQDYRDALDDSEHWCQQISDGVWHAGQNEIERRCGSASHQVASGEQLTTVN